MTKIIEFHSALPGIGEISEGDFDQDIALGMAVGLSARFPWILPAGRVDLAKRTARIVDGGLYREFGSGGHSRSAEHLAPLISRQGRTQDSVHIISISSLQLVETSSWQGISEISRRSERC